MAKQLEIACLFMGKGYGMKVYEKGLEGDTSYSDDLTATQLLLSWAATAVDMVEMAHAITMEYPENIEAMIYMDFGRWYGEWCSENDDYVPPEKKDCMRWLVSNVLCEFNRMLNSSQKERLKALLEEFDQ